MINNKITQSNTNINGSVNSTASSSINSSSSVNSTAGLEKGQLIRGEVTDLRSKEVSVKLEDGRVLSGKLEDSGTLSIGDKVVFRVEDVSLKSLTLKIIANSDFTSEENTIEKALAAAGLSKNSRNSNIVRELLNQQMSIDKRTISLLIQQSILHKETPIETLVLLNKNHIPVNDANLRQFIDYQNSNHSILADISDLADSITDMFRPDDNLPTTEYLTRSSDLLNLLLNDNGEVLTDAVPGKFPAASADLSSASSSDSLMINNNLSNEEYRSTGIILSQQAAMELVDILESDPLTKSLLGTEFLTSLSEGSADLRETAHIISSLFNNTVTAALSSEMMEKLSDSSALREILTANRDLMGANNEIGSTINFSDRIALTNALEAFIHSDNSSLSPANESLQALKERIIAGTVSSQEVLKWIHDNLDTAGEDSSKALLSSKEFKLLLKDSLLNKWTLDPQALNKSEDINRHFESLLNQINGMKEFMEQSSAAGNTNMQGQVTHLNDNINFMNALNQFLSYVQLPLKFKNQLANSELYVYSRKRSGRTANDGISVLLHLDMEHLGPLDIYLDLHDKHLVSKFYLDNTEVMNLITANISLLEDKLSTKGYTLNTEILKREKAVNVVADFLKADTQAAAVTRYNFDLRA